MLNYPELNIWAVLLGFVFNIGLGFLWYSRMTPIGEFWMKEMEYDEADLEPNNLYFGLNFVFALVAIWGLAMVVGISAAETFGEGLLVGLLTWLAFIPTMTFATVAYEERKITVWAIFAGYQLISFVLFGGIFAVWN